MSFNVQNFAPFSVILGHSRNHSAVNVIYCWVAEQIRKKIIDITVVKEIHWQIFFILLKEVVRKKIQNNPNLH